MGYKERVGRMQTTVLFDLLEEALSRRSVGYGNEALISRSKLGPRKIKPL